MDPKPSAMAASRPSLASDFWAVLPVVLAVIAFYAWTVDSNGSEPWVARHQGDYYNLLAEGMARGHLYLNAAVGPPEAHPMAGAQASHDFLLDASRFRNHYYLYFGVTPALTFFLPFQLLTGWELNQLVVVAVQGVMGFGAGLVLLLAWRRHLSQGASRVALLAAAVAWGFGSALPVTLRKPQMYEVAVTAGMAWSTAFLLFAALAILRPNRTRGWLALASLCAGLAVGSRPDLLVGATVLLFVLGWALARTRSRAGGSAAPAWSWILAALAPAAVCGAGLLLYNYRRFGNALEFGHSYQMGSSAAAFFGFRYFWHNLQLYYLTFPATGWLFPFFAEGSETGRPPGYIGIEPVHGQCFCLLWFGALVLLALAGRESRAEGDSRRLGIAILLGWWFTANFLALACISVRANRYLLDFHPALVLATGGLLIEGSALSRPFWRRAFLVVGVAGAAVVAVFNLGISIETMGFMRRVNPIGYARLERTVNRLVWPVFRLTAPRFGPRIFAVTFPAARPGASEPLISAGPPLDGIALMVHYLEPGRAQLVLTNNQISDDQVSGPQGPAFAVVPGETRRLTVQLGAFYPPIGHPWYGDASTADMQRLSTSNRVLLDGIDVFRLSSLAHPASPGQTLVGRRHPWAGAGFERFTGRLRPLAETLPDLTGLRPRPGAGWGYRLVLRLPADRFGLAEPLVTTGTWPVGDAFLLQYRDPHTVVLLHDEIGGGLIGSTEIPVDYAQPQTLDLWFDPVTERGGLPRYRLSLFLEGKPILLDPAPLQPFSYGQEALGASVIQSSLARDTFGGAVLALARTDGANVSRSYSPAHGESAVAVRFRLPPDASRWQPLLNFSRADGERGLLAIRRRGTGILIGWLDAAGWWSREVGGANAMVHTIGLQWRLAAGQGAGPRAQNRAITTVILVDGTICPLTRADFFAAPVTDVTAWSSPWPDSEIAAHFAGAIEPAPEIRTLLAMDAADLPLRHFRLAVRFPSDRVGRNEPLVTAGQRGRADGLYVRYEQNGRVRIGFDHWGVGGPVSRAVPVAADGFNQMEVEFGRGAWTTGGQDRIVVSLNGERLLDAPAVFYATLSNAVKVGANPVGLSTSGLGFGGEIVPMEDFEPQAVSNPAAP